MRARAVAGQWFLGGKRGFFLLLIGIVMVLDYFTGGVTIACSPVYLFEDFLYETVEQFLR